jgi:hypothetical protein
MSHDAKREVLPCFLIEGLVVAYLGRTTSHFVMCGRRFDLSSNWSRVVWWPLVLPGVAGGAHSKLRHPVGRVLGKMKRLVK